MKWSDIDVRPQLTILDHRDFAIAVLGLSSGMLDCRALHLVEQVVRRLVVPLVSSSDKVGNGAKLLAGEVIGVELDVSSTSVDIDDEVFQAKVEHNLDPSPQMPVFAGMQRAKNTMENTTSSKYMSSTCADKAVDTLDGANLVTRTSTISSTASSVCTITNDVSKTSTNPGSSSSSLTSSPQHSRVDSCNDMGLGECESLQNNKHSSCQTSSDDVSLKPRYSYQPLTDHKSSNPLSPSAKIDSPTSPAQTTFAHVNIPSNCPSSLVFSLDCVTELISRLCSALKDPSIVKTSTFCENEIKGDYQDTSENSNNGENDVQTVSKDETELGLLIRRASLRYYTYVRRRVASSTTLYNSLQQLLISRLTSSLNRHLVDYTLETSPQTSSRSDEAFKASVKCWRRFNSVYSRCSRFDLQLYTETSGVVDVDSTNKEIVFSPTPLKDHTLVDSLKIVCINTYFSYFLNKKNSYI